MGNPRNKSARERLDALPNLTDLQRYHVKQIALKLQNRYTKYRRESNPKYRYSNATELDPTAWITLAYRLYTHGILPAVYMTWVIQKLSPQIIFPTTASSHRLFELYLQEGPKELHQRLDQEIKYSVNCILSRVGALHSLKDVLEEEVRKVGLWATDNTLSGHVAAQPDHLDVVVLYIACSKEPTAGHLLSRLFPFARSAMSRAPYLQSRLANELPRELVNDNAFTTPDHDTPGQAVHGTVPLQKPPGS